MRKTAEGATINFKLGIPLLPLIPPFAAADIGTPPPFLLFFHRRPLEDRNPLTQSSQPGLAGSHLLA